MSLFRNLDKREQGSIVPGKEGAHLGEFPCPSTRGALREHETLRDRRTGFLRYINF